jgi:hypothetical protein
MEEAGEEFKTFNQYTKAAVRQVAGYILSNVYQTPRRL